jgi:hypothetical protein
MTFETGPLAITESSRVPCELPPLILHPFDHCPDLDARAERPCSDTSSARYLETRYNEFRMLCLIGKDLNRWLEQCVEVSSSDPELVGMSECNFAAALLFAPPQPVLQKMRSWGVMNFQVIFSRAIGLNAVFPHPPSIRDVSESFLRTFHRYADALYDARLRAEDDSAIEQKTLTFEIYASREPRGSPKSGHRGSLQNRPYINR